MFTSADKDAQKGKKSARKTTRAGGAGIDLQKVAEEQQAKLEKEREEIKEQIKVAKEAAAAAPPPAPAPAKAPAAPKPSKNLQHKDRKIQMHSSKLLSVFFFYSSIFKTSVVLVDTHFKIAATCETLTSLNVQQSLQQSQHQWRKALVRNTNSWE